MKLTAAELKEGMQRLKIDTTVDEMRILIYTYGIDRDGTMNYTEYLNVLGSAAPKRSGGSGSSSSMLSKVITIMKRIIEDKRITPEAFKDAMEREDIDRTYML